MWSIPTKGAVYTRPTIKVKYANTVSKNEDTLVLYKWNQVLQIRRPVRVKTSGKIMKYRARPRGNK